MKGNASERRRRERELYEAAMGREKLAEQERLAALERRCTCGAAGKPRAKGKRLIHELGCPAGARR